MLGIQAQLTVSAVPRTHSSISTILPITPHLSPATNFTQLCTHSSSHPTLLTGVSARSQSVITHALARRQQQQPGSRAAQLHELDRQGGWAADSKTPEASDPFMGDGWGVVVQTQPKAQPAQRKGAAAGVKPKAKRTATPYVDMKSETGVLGMTLLQRKLANDGELIVDGLNLSSL